MAAPTVDVSWDSTNVNTVATTSGHKSAGYLPASLNGGIGEVPSSQEDNYWMNGVYQWITYLAGRIAPRVVPVPLNMLPISGTVAYGTGSGKRYLSATSSGFSEFVYSLAGIPSGNTITDVLLYYNLESGAGIIGEVQGITLNGGATGGGGSITDSSSSGDQAYSFATSGGFSPVAVDGTKCFEMSLTMGQNTRIYGVAVLITPIP